MFEAGIRTVADHYFYVDEVAQAVRDAGMRATLTQVIFGTVAESAGLLDETRRLHRTWDGAAEGRLRVWVGPHSHYTCDEGLLRAAAELARELETGIHLHLADEPWEVEQCRQTYGIGPVALLERASILDQPALCAHAVAIEDEEARVLAAHGAAVATCPKTYLRLGMGNTPVMMLRRHGVVVGVGTDGAASNATLDTWEQQRLAGGLQKFEHRDATLAPPAETLAWATAGSARAAGWGGELGRIAPGYLADVALVDPSAPHLTPAPDPVVALAGACRPSDMQHLLVQGQLVLQDRELLTVDRRRAAAEVAARAERLRASGAAQ
jgi:5-methylthioadenosine/S-adenosylhomocysteine deaminase